MTDNRAPYAYWDSLETTAGIPLIFDLTANDRDPDGDPLTILEVGEIKNGTLTINDDGRTVTYTPNAGYTGYEVFSYTVTDDRGGESTSNSGIIVRAPVVTNKAPYAYWDALETTAGILIEFDLTANDIDPDGDDLSILEVSDIENGTLVINDDGKTVTYTPDAGYTGYEVFSYTVTDGKGGESTSNSGIVVEAPVVTNKVPYAYWDALETTAGVPIVFDLTANDLDPDGDELSILEVSEIEHGTIVINDDGSSVTYTPYAGYTGYEVFSYTVSDGNGGEATSKGGIVVNPALVTNEAPEARDDVMTTFVGHAVNFDVLANDHDADGDALTMLAVGDASNGSVSINDDGTVRYAPDDGFSGSDRFTYEVSDGNGGSDIGAVLVQVSNVEPGTPIVDVTLQSLSGAEGSIHSFGHAFEQGDLPASLGFVGEIDGNPVLAQIDAKSNWPDGSVKHGIVSIQIPTGVGATETLTLTSSASSGPSTAINVAEAALSSGYDFAVEIDLDGETYVVDVDELVQDQAGEAWLAGALASEVRVEAILSVGDAKLDFRFDVRAQADGTIRTGVTASFDDVTTTGNDNIVYDFRIIESGNVIDSADDLLHRHHTNWHNKYYSGGSESGVHVQFDIDYLQSTGIIPTIDDTLTSRYSDVYGTELASGVDRLNGDALDFGPMGAGTLYTYQPASGDREDLGFLPEWAVMYLYDQSQLNHEALIENGYAAGSVGWHMSDPDTGSAVRLDDASHADRSWDFGHGWHDDFQGSGTTHNTYFSDIADHPDQSDAFFALERGAPSHKPSISYLPYVVTGDRYHLEELYHEVAYGVFGRNPGYRDDDGFSIEGQLRGQAWLLRDIFQASQVAPEGEAQAYFQGMLDAHLTGYRDFYVRGEAFTTPDGSLTFDYRKAGTDLEGVMVTYGNTPDTDATIAPWQQDHFGIVIGHIAATGNTVAQEIANWMSNFSAGRFLQSDFDPTWAATYQMADWDDANDIESWSDLGDAIEAGGFDSAAEASENNPFGANYPMIAWGSMASLFSGTHNAVYAEAYALIANANQDRIVNFSSDNGSRNTYGGQQAYSPTFMDGTQVSFSAHEFGTSGDDTVSLGNGNVFYHGDAGDDEIVAGNGNSIIDGGDGDDRIEVGTGENWIFAGSGADLIKAGSGVNILQGDRHDVDFGDFADQFVFEARLGDTNITDFDDSDKVVFLDVAGISSARDVIARLRDNAEGNALLELDTLGSIEFVGRSAGSLNDDSFFATGLSDPASLDGGAANPVSDADLGGECINCAE